MELFKKVFKIDLETRVATNILPVNEISFLKAARNLKKALQQKGYIFKYAEYQEGHTWGNWRNHFIDAVIHFFPR